MSTLSRPNHDQDHEQDHEQDHDQDHEQVLNINQYWNENLSLHRHESFASSVVTLALFLSRLQSLLSLNGSKMPQKSS
jgi:hypothetical protein